MIGDATQIASWRRCDGRDDKNSDGLRQRRCIRLECSEERAPERWK